MRYLKSLNTTDCNDNYINIYKYIYSCKREGCKYNDEKKTPGVRAKQQCNIKQTVS